MSADPTAASDPVILLADGASFEAGYIASVLRERGMVVVGPMLALQDVVTAIAGHWPCVVVVGHVLPEPERAELAATLKRYDVPCLTLMANTAFYASDTEPMLMRPFAAFQVADWVSERRGRSTDIGEV